MTLVTTPECNVCKNIQAVADCVVCKKTLCPEHRWGTGSHEEGYRCLQGDCGFDAILPRAYSSDRPWAPKSTSTPLLFVGISLGFVLLGFLMAAFLDL